MLTTSTLHTSFQEKPVPAGGTGFFAFRQLSVSDRGGPHLGATACRAEAEPASGKDRQARRGILRASRVQAGTDTDDKVQTAPPKSQRCAGGALSFGMVRHQLEKFSLGLEPNRPERGMCFETPFCPHSGPRPPRPASRGFFFIRARLVGRLGSRRSFRRKARKGTRRERSPVAESGAQLFPHPSLPGGHADAGP